MTGTTGAPPWARPDGRSRQAVVRDHVLAAIGRGELVPGQRIKQRDLAAEVGVSVTPVREALRELQAMGVVRFNPHQGVTVSPLDLDQVVESTRIADALLPYLAEVTADRITAEELQQAEQVCALLESTTELGQFMALNKVFHSVLTRAAKSARLEAIFSQDRVIVERVVCVSLHTLGDRYEQANVDHREMVEALRRRDARWYAEVSRRHQRPFEEFVARLGESSDAADRRAP